MNHSVKTFVSVLISICVLYVVLFTSVDAWCFNRSFYKYEGSQLDLKETLGVDQHDLYDMSDTLLDYLSGYRNDIKVKVTSFDKSRYAYTYEEQLHMKDVRTLYQTAKLLRNVLAVLAIFLWLLMRYTDRKDCYMVISSVFIRTSIVFLFLMSGLAFYAASDFNTFWTQFHHVFFQNDLWLLPPYSMMIRLLPETFFAQLVMCILITFFVVFILLLFFSAIYRRRWIEKNSEKVFIK